MTVPVRGDEVEDVRHGRRDSYINLTLGYPVVVTWGEFIRRLKDAGFVEQRRGKGSPRQFIHPERKKVITVSAHTKKEVGTGLAHRILKEAGL